MRMIREEITMLPDFFKYPKIPRYENQLFTISEKIDGSNGLVHIDKDTGHISAGCRTRWLVNDGSKSWDNQGFGQWVLDHSSELKALGSGYHYGEWYGKSINRNYGLPSQKFMLFHSERYEDIELPLCVELETIIHSDIMPDDLDMYKTYYSKVMVANGSYHVPDFKQPEGLVIRNQLTNGLMKVIIPEFEDKPKRRR